MKAIVVVILALLVCACSRPGVRCDGRLTPINAPAPAVTGGQKDSSKPSPEKTP